MRVWKEQWNYYGGEYIGSFSKLGIAQGPSLKGCFRVSGIGFEFKV